MNKMRSCRMRTLILVSAAILLLVVGIYALTRPISYGASYYHASFYDGEDFNGSMIFDSDNTMVVRNTTFDEELKLYYYYKNGYAFFTVSETEAEYREEVAAINENFEEAVNTPFYAAKINVIRMSSVGPDGYRSVYICRNSLMLAVAWGAIELALIVFAIASERRCKKEKCEE